MPKKPPTETPPPIIRQELRGIFVMPLESTLIATIPNDLKPLIYSYERACLFTGKKSRTVSCSPLLDKPTLKKSFSLKAQFGGKLNSTSLQGGGVPQSFQSVAIEKSTGNLWIVDKNHHTLVVCSSDGHFIKTVGKQGANPGQLIHPISLVFDFEGNVVVTMSHRIQVFTPNGEPKLVIGKRGAKRGEFQEPCGVTIDPAGNIVVADSENDRIQVNLASPHLFSHLQ